MSFERFSLTTQLVVVFVLVLFFVFGTIGIIEYQYQKESYKHLQIKKTESILKSISTSIGQDIYSNNYIGIEYKLLGFSSIEDISILVVTNIDGQILSEVEYLEGLNARPTYRYGMKASPEDGQYVIFDDADNLTYWLPVNFAGNQIAWIQSYSEMENELWRDTLINYLAILGSVFITAILVIYLFLKIKMNSLGLITEFSRKLPDFNGETIQLNNSSSELDVLVKALNWGSQKISEQRAQLLQSNVDLEERVEDRTRELLHAKNEAERASNAKTEFLSRMSHELRTPLNAILGFSQVLWLDKVKLSSDQRESVEEINTAGEHLLSMVNEVLDLARVESGMVELEITDQRVDVVIANILSMLQPLIEERNIRIHMEYDAGISWLIKCDIVRVKQVFINVLSNAIKYNKLGGDIFIDLEILDLYIRVKIRDTGIGISKHDIKRIFSPFERVSGANAIEGTGVGLSVTKKLLELMGADVSVQSVLNEGSTFTLTFKNSD